MALLRSCCPKAADAGAPPYAVFVCEAGHVRECCSEACVKVFERACRDAWKLCLQAKKRLDEKRKRLFVDALNKIKKTQGAVLVCPSLRAGKDSKYAPCCALEVTRRQKQAAAAPEVDRAAAEVVGAEQLLPVAVEGHGAETSLRGSPRLVSPRRLVELPRKPTASPRGLRSSGPGRRPPKQRAEAVPVCPPRPPRESSQRAVGARGAERKGESLGPCPPPPPRVRAPWRCIWDDRHQRYFFLDEVTGLSRWELSSASTSQYLCLRHVYGRREEDQLLVVHGDRVEVLGFENRRSLCRARHLMPPFEEGLLPASALGPLPPPGAWRLACLYEAREAYRAPGHCQGYLSLEVGDVVELLSLPESSGWSFAQPRGSAWEEPPGWLPTCVLWLTPVGEGGLGSA